MSTQTDKKKFKKMCFSFSAHLIMHVGIIYLKKNRKLQEIFSLHIYIQYIRFNRFDVAARLHVYVFEKFVTAPVNKDPSSDCRSHSYFYDM